MSVELTVMGLVLDIAGVVILGIGGVLRPAARIRQSGKTYGELNPRLFERIPVRFALRRGSLDPFAGEVAAVEEIAPNGATCGGVR